MAKEGKGKLIGMGITFLVLFTGIIATWTVYGEDIDDNAVAVIRVDTEGCKPIAPIKLDIALIKKDIETIQKSQGEMKTEQTAMREEQRDGFQAILERLPK